MLSLLGCVPCLAQLTLEECYRKARENYPLVKQYGLIEKTKDYNVANAGKGYLPQVAFSAQATYQSDVTEIPIDFDIDFEQIGLAGIDIPTLDKAQYGATLEVSQTLWDGGAIRSEQENARAQADVELRDLDVNLYALHERVNQLYFKTACCRRSCSSSATGWHPTCGMALPARRIGMLCGWIC